MITNTSTVTCGACSAETSADAKFCLQCGHGLYENCPECSKPVALTQPFCSHCGQNLIEAIEAKRQRFESMVSQALSCAKEDDFETATSLLQGLAANKDYRYREVVELAAESLDKIAQIAAARENLANELMQRAQPKIDAQDHEAVVAILKNAPMRLLTKEMLESLRLAQEFLSGQVDSHELLKDALNRRDWIAAGPLLDHLMDTLSEGESLHTLAVGVANKLTKNAKQSVADGRYQAAIESLKAVPSTSGVEELAECQKTAIKMQQWIDDVLWIRKQLEDQPFDTPVLGRLAKRLQKLEPKVPDHAQSVQQIAANLKQGKRPEHGILPYRNGPPVSKLGGEIEFLCRLNCVDYGDLGNIVSAGAQMNVAFGLALQGLGVGDIKSSFGSQKGVFKKLLAKKVESAWGFDVGSATVKGVLLAKEGDALVVKDAFFKELDAPTCRAGSENPDAGFETLQAVLEQREMGDTPVWCNLPSDSLISRFTQLPPVNDSVAKGLVEREINERLPMDKDDLYLSTYIAPHDENSNLGRSAGIAAIRKVVVDERRQKLSDLGVNVGGMQADPLALANLISVEYKTLWEGGDEEDQQPLEKLPTVAALHCGAAATSLLFVTKNTHWVWTVQFGGEDLTSVLARKTKLTKADAEAAKRKPSTLAHPGDAYPVVEDRVNSWVSSRLNTLIDQAQREFAYFDVQHVVASGGASMTHGWVHATLM
ncbi:Competence protein A [Stieleria bergensis]|uniref:Competence protein A n=1 Tax=Stieleria bergensis TaxID=2528025 RepID=A0A517SPC9_9BACT|nr:Competence protein A [Planctomycetes bacterium SV_7m_r]